MALFEERHSPVQPDFRLFFQNVNQMYNISQRRYERFFENPTEIFNDYGLHLNP